MTALNFIVILSLMSLGMFAEALTPEILRAHSEKAGKRLPASGGRAAPYGALRELSCSPCAGAIREGGLFTGEVEPA